MLIKLSKEELTEVNGGKISVSIRQSLLDIVDFIDAVRDFAYERKHRKSDIIRRIPSYHQIVDPSRDIDNM